MDFMTTPTAVVVALVIYLVGAVVVGWTFGRRGAKSEEGYFIAGRNLGPIPLAFSVVATVMSGAVFTGTVGFFYVYGTRFLGYALAFGTLVAMTYWVVGRRLWPIAKARRYVTMQGFLGDFYQSHILRLAAAVVSVVFLVPYFAAGGVALGVVLESAVGLPYQYGVWLMMAGTLLYAAYGGLAAVAYTDVYQGVINVGVGVIAVIGLLVVAGGYGEVMRGAGEVATFAIEPELLVIFWGWLLFMGFGHITQPDRMTRIMAARSIPHLRQGALTIGGLMAVVALIFLLSGLASQALLPGIEATDTALPSAISEFLPWLVPLFVVVIWSTGMSTIDSGLVTASTIFTRDIIQNYVPNLASNRRRTLIITRALVFVMALVAVGIALSQPPFIWQLVGLFVSVNLQWLPPLIAGLYWKRVTKLGAEAGWIVGMLITIYLSFWSPVDLPFGVFPGMLSMLVNAIVLVGVSYATKPLPAAHVDEHHRLYRQTEFPETAAAPPPTIRP
jgi:SSS family transporter